MNTFLYLSLLSQLLISINATNTVLEEKSNCFIKDIERKNSRNFTIYYNPGSTCKTKSYRLYKKGATKYICQKKKKIYLSAEVDPEFKGDLCSIFTTDFDRLNDSDSRVSSIVVIFMLDAKGNISNRGFLREGFQVYANRHVEKKLREISSEQMFKPAMVEGKPVASMYALAIMFDNSSCVEPFSKSFQD